MAVTIQDHFRLGAVIRRSLAVMRNNFLPFSILFILINAPSSLYLLKIADRLDADSDTGVRLLQLMETFLSYLATAAVTYATLQELRGQHVGFREFCSRGLAQGGVAIRVALVSGLCIVVGALFLVIPALILIVIWWVAIPVAVAERRGAIASLGRSSELTKGNRWRIFALLIAFIVAAALAGIFLGMVVGIPAYLLGGGDEALGRFVIVATWLWTSLFMAGQAVLTAVGYFHLRVAKEGIGIDDIAAVFD